MLQIQNKPSNHPWLLILYIVLFALNLVSFHVHNNITGSYWLSTSILSFFNKNFNTTDTNNNNITLNYQSINSYTDLQRYYLEYVPDKFFRNSADVEAEFLSDRKILYGPYRFHITRLKTTDCFDNYDISRYNNTNNYNVLCIHKYINQDTIYKEILCLNNSQNCTENDPGVIVYK